MTVWKRWRNHGGWDSVVLSSQPQGLSDFLSFYSKLLTKSAVDQTTQTSNCCLWQLLLKKNQICPWLKVCLKLSSFRLMNKWILESAAYLFSKAFRQNFTSNSLQPNSIRVRLSNPILKIFILLPGSYSQKIKSISFSLSSQRILWGSS